MPYLMEAKIEAERLEKQVFQQNYSLAEELKPFHFGRHENVLDAGCGTGVLSRFLVEHFKVEHVDGMDVSETRLQQAAQLLDDRSKKNIHFHPQDLSSIDAKFHRKYDTVIARYVLEHVPDARSVLGELLKTLKPGGRLIVFELDGVFINLYSDNPKLQAYMKAFEAGAHFDLHIGRKIPAQMKQAGFVDIEWNPTLVVCKGVRLDEERMNTEYRFKAAMPLLIQAIGKNCAEEFKALYLEEMKKNENTLVFTKFICTGKRA